MKPLKSIKNKGFTLLELLIVISILAISATVVTLVLHPAEQISQANDSRRLSELATIDKALQIVTSQGITYIGSPNLVYISLPSNNSNCSDLDLPSLSGGWQYRCATEANYRKVNGSGWIPVNFASSTTGAPFGALPIDPINTPESGFYYTYVISGNGWEDTAILETTKYQQQYATKDGGQSDIAVEVGSKHKITPYEVVTRTTGGSLFAIGLTTNPAGAGTITFDGTNYNNGENINKAAGSYVIVANPNTGYTFTSWATTGGLTVANPSSANTSVAVDNTGSLQMNLSGSGFTVTFATNPVAGSITFDGSSYTNGQTTSKPSGTYNISANPGSGNTFTSWITTGGLTVANPTNANTTVTVSGAGTLQMNQNKQIVYNFEAGEEGWTHGIYGGTKDWLRANAFTGSCALSLGTYGMVDQQCYILANNWLRSPIIDMTGSTAATLSLKVWQSDENGGCYASGSYDRKDLRICQDAGGGGTGVTNCTVLGCSTNWANTGAWNTYSYSISAYAGFSNVVLMFRYNTGDSCCGEKGWAVDDITITY